MYEQKLKSYWSRPGGKQGTIIGLGLLGLITWKILPILTQMVWNTINFSIAVLCGAALAYVIMDRRWRLYLLYIYETVMGAIVGLIWKINPWVAAEDNIKQMIKDREMVGKKAKEMSAARIKVDNKIAERKSEMDREAKLAKSAAEKGTELAIAQAKSSQRIVGNIAKFLETLIPLRNDLKIAEEYLSNIYEKGEIHITEAQHELDLKRDQFEATKIGRSALESAVRMFQGDPERKLLLKQSMEAIAETTASNMASMQQSIKIADRFLEKMEIESGVYESDGIEILKQLSDQGFTRASDVVMNRISQDPGLQGSIPKSKLNDLLES